jgi:hypothetical protein
MPLPALVSRIKPTDYHEGEVRPSLVDDLVPLLVSAPIPCLLLVGRVVSSFAYLVGQAVGVSFRAVKYRERLTWQYR